MAPDSAQFRHPAWISAAGTIVGYGLIIALLTVLLFLIPYAVFASL